MPVLFRALVVKSNQPRKTQKARKTLKARKKKESSFVSTFVLFVWFVVKNKGAGFPPTATGTTCGHARVQYSGLSSTFDSWVLLNSTLVIQRLLGIQRPLYIDSVGSNLFDK